MAESREIRLNWPPRNDGDRGPSDRQAEFLRCGAREQLYGGSKRGGKTVAGCAKAIYLSCMFPGNRGLIARQAFTDLRDSTLVTFFQLCPPELIIGHQKQEHRITLRTAEPKYPSTIIYRGLGEDTEGGVSAQKAKEKAKAIETGWYWVDEPSEVAFDAYRMMLSQLCWFLPNGKRPPYMALLTSNPEPGWVKDRFIDTDHPDYIIGRSDARFIPSLPHDNPGLPINWETDLRSTMDADWVRRYLDGSWDIHEGMVFTGLDERIHNLDNYIDPHNEDLWQQFHVDLKPMAALDHATTGITAYLRSGIDVDENCFALEEYYQEDKRIDEHAIAIKALDEKYINPLYRLIDPSTEAKTLQNKTEMFSVQDAYRREGIKTISAHRANISVGIDLIKQYLHINPLHTNPFTLQRGAPRLYISKRRCQNLWREMVNLKKEIKPDGSIEFVGRDHALDDLRYILMSRPGAQVQKKKDIAKLPTLDQVAHRSMDKFFSKFGQTKSDRWF
jgi:PBSX family phage terminase large subunit